MLNPELYNYWVVIVLMMVGFYTLITRGNLVKKIIGLNVFQVSVFMLYISMGKITGGTAPILYDDEWKQLKQAQQHAHHAHHDDHVAGTAHDADKHADDHASSNSRAALPRENRTLAGPVLRERRGDDEPSVRPDIARGKPYSNPLPHVLILTAIVVGVATTSLGLALVVRIREAYGTIEEDEIQGLDDEP